MVIAAFAKGPHNFISVQLGLFLLGGMTEGIVIEIIPAKGGGMEYGSCLWDLLRFCLRYTTS